MSSRGWIIGLITLLGAVGCGSGDIRVDQDAGATGGRGSDKQDAGSGGSGRSDAGTDQGGRGLAGAAGSAGKVTGRAGSAGAAGHPAGPGGEGGGRAEGGAGPTAAGAGGGGGALPMSGGAPAEGGAPAGGGTGPSASGAGGAAGTPATGGKETGGTGFGGAVDIGGTAGTSGSGATAGAGGTGGTAQVAAGAAGTPGDAGCHADGDCPTGEVCAAYASDGLYHCTLPSETGAALGEPCDTEPTYLSPTDECESRLCLGFSDRCTRLCIDNADCGAGFTCVDWGNERVCMGVCTVSDDCDSGHVCSVFYNASSDAYAWACSNPRGTVATGDTPLGGTCAGDHGCETALCLTYTYDTTTTYHCTSACENAGDCPDSLPTCGTVNMGLASGGAQPVSACLPASSQ